eukprot:6384416-Amphidinium_carterae.1
MLSPTTLPTVLLFQLWSLGLLSGTPWARWMTYASGDFYCLQCQLENIESVLGWAIMSAGSCSGKCEYKLKRTASVGCTKLIRPFHEVESSPCHPMLLSVMWLPTDGHTALLVQ